MAILLDTSILIDIERGMRPLPEDEDFVIATVTAAELLHGLMMATKAHRARREAFVEHVFELVPTIPFNLTIARTYARIWVEALRSGRSPGAHDLMVAATALTLDVPLATLNRRDFVRISGLRLWDKA